MPVRPHRRRLRNPVWDQPPGHFFLVNHLASLMQPGARLVNLSSAGHRFAGVDLADPNFERTPCAPLVAYGRSKTTATAGPLDPVADLISRSAEIAVGDLSDATETRSAADQVNAIGRMEAIIHNAGIYDQRTRGSTAERHATVLAVNALAPYMLTALIERPDRLIYLSSGLHRGGEGPLRDIDWMARRWDRAQAYAESELYVAALAFGLSRRWPDVLTNAVDPGWVRTRMRGQGAPVDLDTGQRTQAWLAASTEAAAMVSGRTGITCAKSSPLVKLPIPPCRASSLRSLAN